MNRWLILCSLLILPGLAWAGDFQETRCSACHITASWKKVSFDHDRTGWPLLGVHRETTCRKCHETKLETPTPNTCAGCHTDPHAQSLGTQCASCHDPRSWASQMDPVAHRRGLFPLTGRHAIIPCEECHVDRFQRGFSRAALQCVQCHTADYQQAGLTSIDHVVAGFDTDCQRCHSPRKFDQATLPGHGLCFNITGGEHAGIGCKSCHSSLKNVKQDGTCQTQTAACTSCHEHRCENEIPQHREVPGFECKDRKCYECHQN